MRRATLRYLMAPSDPDRGVTFEEARLPRRGPDRDPFDLRGWVTNPATNARHLRAAPGPVVVVAPRRWGPRRILPGPVVEGAPMGLLLATRAADLPPLRRGPDPSAPWVVAAMAKDVFLRPTDGWAGALERGGRATLDLRADRARRSELVRALHAGPGVVLYAGHGRNRGWGGYQGLRLPHLEATSAASGPFEVPSAGLVIAFACDTLKRSRNRTPFGIRLVASGHARAYLGAVGAIRTSDAEALAELVVEILARRAHRRAWQLMTAVDDAVGSSASARRAWAHFRLIGDPRAPLYP